MKYLTGIAVVFLASSGWARSPEVAMVTDLVGRVEVEQSPTPWRAAALDEGLLLGDGMRTWERSNAELRFVDGTVLMLSERTRMRITTALFNPAEAPAPIQVALAAGGLEVRAGRAPLEVSAAGGAVERVAPGESAYIEVAPPGAPGGLRQGPPRMTVSVDIAPEPSIQLPNGTPTAIDPGAGGGGSAGEVRPVNPMPEAPLPAPPDPIIEPEEVPPTPDPTPGPTQVRVRVEVRVRP